MTAYNIQYQFIKFWLLMCGVNESAIPFMVPLEIFNRNNK